MPSEVLLDNNANNNNSPIYSNLIYSAFEKIQNFCPKSPITLSLVFHKTQMTS